MGFVVTGTGVVIGIKGLGVVVTGNGVVGTGVFVTAGTVEAGVLMLKVDFSHPHQDTLCFRHMNLHTRHVLWDVATCTHLNLHHRYSEPMI